jgi:formiminoglutamase
MGVPDPIRAALRPAIPGLWAGRVDGDEPAVRRFHQVMRPLGAVEAISAGSVAFIGYACDEGVRRNRGRTGAAAGPDALRSALAGLPTVSDSLRMFDLGDIAGEDVAATQELLAKLVARAVQAGSLPVVLGGGHDLAFGSWLGVRRGREGVVGAINLDAHLDLRPVPADGPNSGTSYSQASDECVARGGRLHYAIVGIQPTGNTRGLLERARSLGVEMHGRGRCVAGSLDAFLAGTDAVAFSIDLDAFSAAAAPGVSAPTSLGIVPDDHAVAFVRGLAADSRIAAIDLAELNPSLDLDGRTARLGASLLWHAIDARFGGRP